MRLRAEVRRAGCGRVLPRHSGQLPAAPAQASTLAQQNKILMDRVVASKGLIAREPSFLPQGTSSSFWSLPVEDELFQLPAAA